MIRRKTREYHTEFSRNFHNTYGILCCYADFCFSYITWCSRLVIINFCNIHQQHWSSSSTYPNLSNTVCKSKLWETCQKRKFKALKNTFKPAKFCYFYWPDCFKIKQNTAISKHFTQSIVYTRTTNGTIFSADVWISGGQVSFQYKAFASKSIIISTNMPFTYWKRLIFLISVSYVKRKFMTS